MIKSPLPVCLLATPLLLVACGHDDGTLYATPGGLYQGTLTAAAGQPQDQAYAIVDESGYGRMIDYTSGDYYQLALTNQGLKLSGTFEQYSPTAETSTEPGTFAGSLDDQGLNATLSEDGSAVASLAMLLDFNYFNGSNLNLLAGNWAYSATDGSYSITLDISASGAFTGSDSDNCSYSGNFTIFDPYYDAYHAAYTETCAGASASYSGVASYYYADSQYPAGILLLADDNAGSFLAVQVLSAPAAAVQQPAMKGTPRRPAPSALRHPLAD